MSSMLARSGEEGADLSDADAGAPAPHAAPGFVNYESAAVVEVAIDGSDYRIDAGKQGTTLSISVRKSGTWDWAFGGEARWNGSSLKSRNFERSVLQELSSALKQALADLE